MLKIRIADGVVLVGALKPGEELLGGAVVEVDDKTAEDWIAKGWALPDEQQAVDS